MSVLILLWVYYYYKKELIKNSIDHALHYGRVPRSYSQKIFTTHLADFKKLLQHDKENFPFLQGHVLYQQYGFSISRCYNCDLINNGMIEDDLIDLTAEQMEGYRHQALITLDAPNLTPYEKNHAIFQLMQLGLCNDDLFSTEYIGDLFAHGKHLEQDVIKAFHWYCLDELRGLRDSVAGKIYRIVKQHPAIDFHHKKDEVLLFEDFHRRKQQQNICVEDWQTRFVSDDSIFKLWGD